MEITKYTLPETIEGKEIFKMGIKEAILDGEMNPLEFYRVAKMITDAMEELKKDPDIFDCAYTEVLKYGKEKPKINGAVIEISQRSTPDYKSCNDSTYNRLKEELSAREKLLKNLPPEGMADPSTGELLMPPTLKISSFVKVNI